jgi:hypothetical protein
MSDSQLVTQQRMVLHSLLRLVDTYTAWASRYLDILLKI